MAMDIVAVVTNLPTGIKRDDATVDRLHHRYTVIIILVFCVIVTATQYYGTPIVCWVPAEFGGGWTSYTNGYCWIKNTYHLPYEDEIPKDWEPEKRDEIIYYQWMPFILVAQAIMFYAPSVVWHAMNSKSGVDSDNILASAQTFNKAEKMENRERMLTLIVNQINRFVGSSHRRRRSGINICRICCCCGKRFGNYLIMLYIVTKLLYIGNVFAQMFFLNGVLQTDFFSFGVDALTRWTDDSPDTDMQYINNTIFPKVTMCDFKIRRLGNLHRYTVQCTLPINLYIEKLYILLWVWCLFLLVITTLDLITWICRTVLGQDKLTYIRNHLYDMKRLNNRNQINASVDFVYEYLKQDGVFLCRMIGHNTNYITVSEIIAALWDNWRDDKCTMDDDDDPNANDETPMLGGPPNNARPRMPPPPAPPKKDKPPLPPKPPVSPPVTPSAPPPEGEKPPLFDEYGGSEP